MNRVKKFQIIAAESPLTRTGKRLGCVGKLVID
jgi:hypothetical protein